MKKRRVRLIASQMNFDPLYRSGVYRYDDSTLHRSLKDGCSAVDFIALFAWKKDEPQFLFIEAKTTSAESRQVQTVDEEASIADYLKKLVGSLQVASAVALGLHDHPQLEVPMFLAGGDAFKRPIRFVLVAKELRTDHLEFVQRCVVKAMAPCARIWCQKPSEFVAVLNESEARKRGLVA